MESGIDFEFKKSIYDVKRIIIFIIAFSSLLLLFTFIITKVFLIVPNNPPIRNYEYTQAFIDSLINRRDFYYEEYLIQIGQLPPREGEIFVKGDPDNFLKLYKYYDYLIENKPNNFIELYSISHTLFMPGSYGIQAYIYMVMPLFMFGSIYHVFREDKITDFCKNYNMLGVDNKKMRRGKIVFSASSISILYIVLNLFALIFLPNYNVLAYSYDSYYLSNTYLIFFQRMIEMYLTLIPLYILLLMLEKWIENDKYYFLASSIASIILLSGIAILFQYVITNASDNTLIMIPFFNLFASEGFIDGNIVYKLIYPIVAVASVFIVDFGIKKYKESIKEGKTC